MRIAILSDGIVVQAAVFDNLAVAQKFLDAGYLQGDAVAELPDNYGIGDLFDGEAWAHPPVPPAAITHAERDEWMVDIEYRLLLMEAGLV